MGGIGDLIQDLGARIGIGGPEQVEAPPPPPPPAAEAAPEAASPYVAKTTARAASTGISLAGLQARLQDVLGSVSNAITASNPTGVRSADGSEYRPGAPKVADGTPLPADADPILQGFSQFNGPGPGGEQCGAACVVAGAVAAKGKAGAAELAEGLSKDKGLNAAEKKKFADIAKALKGPNATYGDLGKLTDALHKSFGVPLDNGEFAMDGPTLTGLMARPPNSGKNVPMKLNIQDESGASGNHWVVVRGGQNGGQAWDPMPKDGSQLVDAGAYRSRMAAQRGRSEDPSSYGFPPMPGA